MVDRWFRWEREATPHLLFPTLEGSMEPLKRYIGFGFPTTILIFKDGVVTWCMKEVEFLEFGKRLREIFVSKGKEKRFAKDLRNTTLALNRIESLIVKQDLSKLSDKELVTLYKKLYQYFINFYRVRAISTPLAFETETYLKQNSDISDEDFNLLTRPRRDSFAKEAEKYLLKTRDIEGFIERFYWIDNNYSGTRVLTEKDVRARLKDLSLHKRIKRVIPKTKLNAKVERLIELLRNYALYKDVSKKHMLIFLHFLETLLKEISWRTDLSKEDLRSTFPFEVSKVLAGKIGKQKISERKKYCVVVWEENKKSPKILTGYKARRWEKIVYSKGKDQVKVIVGRTACRGKVLGRVRILSSAKDCDKLKVGEILVTFMTSPDFMPAIRRCSAIITNFGGVTSHAAVISRELQIPCIVGTKIATHVLKNGDLVEVDGNTGIIKVI